MIEQSNSNPWKLVWSLSYQITSLKNIKKKNKNKKKYWKRFYFYKSREYCDLYKHILTNKVTLAGSILQYFAQGS